MTEYAKCDDCETSARETYLFDLCENCFKNRIRKAVETEREKTKKALEDVVKQGSWKAFLEFRESFKTEPKKEAKEK